jgi:hypothetical protein
MRPFQGRRSLALFSGGVAPGYYIVPLRGETSARCAEVARVAMPANPRRGFIK